MRRLSAFLLASVLAAAPARAETLKIGVMAVLSGPAASLGQQVRDGFALGVARAGGKLGGMDTQVIVVDSELKPDVAVTKVRDLLDRDQVSFVVGPVFSNELAAIFKPVTDSGAILISPNAGSSVYAGRGCNANFYVTSYENDQMHATLGKVAQESGYKRVVMIAPNYQAGRDAMAGFKSAYQGEVLDELYVPLTQMDFQSELARIAAAKPDAVYAFMPGGLGIALVKQYRQAGLAGIPFLSAFTVDESVLPAERDAALGFFSGTNWAPNMDNAANRAFVAVFEDTYHYVPATYAAQAYDAAQLIDSAVRAVHAKLDDKAGLRTALERADFPSVRGAFRFGANHYPVQDFWLAQVVQRPDGKFQTQTVKKIFANSVDPFAAECHMK